MEKVNLANKFGLFQEYWSPKIAGELNDSYLKLAKLKGEFLWHHHEAEYGLFLLVQCRLVIKRRYRDISLDEGEFVIIPRVLEHWPVSQEKVHLLLLPPI